MILMLDVLQDPPPTFMRLKMENTSDFELVTDIGGRTFDWPTWYGCHSNLWPFQKLISENILKLAFRLDDSSSNVSIHFIDLLSNEMFEINTRIKTDKNWITRLTRSPSGKMSRLLETEFFLKFLFWYFSRV